MLALLAATVLSTQNLTAPTDWPALGPNAVTQRWQAQKRGLFIHYGMSTFTGDEYGHKPADVAQYAPTGLDPEQWVRVAKDAGFRYAVLTTKHCYGHCLWSTNTTDFGVKTSEQQDVVQLFVEACRKHGILPGFYYLLGWDTRHQPKMTPDQYERFCTAQLTELLTRYGPIFELWLDIPTDLGPDTDKALNRIYRAVKKLQPDCMVLLNQGFRDGSKVPVGPVSWLRRYDNTRQVGIWPTDVMNGERTLPPPSGHEPKIRYLGQDYHLPMEVQDLTAHEGWFWLKHDALRTPLDLYRIAKATADRKANLLLNAGPDRSGTIPQATVDRLLEFKRAIVSGKIYQNLLEGAKAAASNVYRSNPEYGPDKAVDGSPDTRWATDDRTPSAWIEFSTPKGIRFDRLRIVESWNRIRSYTVRAWTSAGWSEIAKGTTIGGSAAPITVPPTKAFKLRIDIHQSTDGPTLWTVEAFDSRYAR